LEEKKFPAIVIKKPAVYQTNANNEAARYEGDSSSSDDQNLGAEDEDKADFEQ
jgi:hypothetical protein